MSPYVIAIRPVEPADAPVIAQLHDEAFGPGRFARAAYAVREGLGDRSDVCMAAAVGPAIVAAVRYAPITIGGTGGALLLGPLVVEPRLAGQGIGRRLVAASLERAEDLGYRLVLLVGDEPYYKRFGFVRVPEGQIAMPRPVNPARLLALELEPGALADYRGAVAGAQA